MLILGAAAADTMEDVGRFLQYILSGQVLRRITIDGRPAAELLGEGDLIRPWQDSPSLHTVLEASGWHVLAPLRLALLDAEVSAAMCAYPELAVSMVERSIHRTRSLALTMAIAHQVRIDVRVHLLLWLLADRWGRVRSDAVLLPVRLTHAIIGELVGAQRATVTTGLAELMRAGLVARHPEGFELFGGPPGQAPGARPDPVLQAQV